MEAEGNTPQEFAAAISREIRQWQQLVKAAGIKAH
jgi:tripartite-type tricarboxylate transporter receptor subunit TctC